jgi:hypothetical protein
MSHQYYTRNEKQLLKIHHYFIIDITRNIKKPLLRQLKPNCKTLDDDMRSCMDHWSNDLEE